MKGILFVLISVVVFSAQAAQYLCDPMDQYNFNARSLIVELNDFEIEAIVLMEQNGEYKQFPYNKKIIMKPTISGSDGRWWGNDFDFPGEDYQVFLSNDGKKMRFWVDIWTESFFGSASAYSESCRLI